MAVATEQKLTIELVPKTCWYSNLRNAMPRSNWDKLRKKVYADYGHRCGVCSAANVRLNCHEIWEYDDQRHIQRLGGFVCLCDMCHHVKHLGHAGILAREGRLDYGEVIDHYLKVNVCDMAAFDQHRTAAFDQWEERSQHPWTTDFGEYAGLIQGATRELR